MGSKGLLVKRPAPGQKFLVVRFRGPLPRWEAAVCGCPKKTEDSLKKIVAARTVWVSLTPEKLRERP